MNDKWIYYDSKTKELVKLHSFQFDGDRQTPTMIGGRMISPNYSSDSGTLTVSSSEFSIKYVKNMVDENFSYDGRSKYKADVVRTIILMNDSGRAIELNGCLLQSTDFNSSFEIEFPVNLDEKIEMVFRVDYYVEHSENSEAYYSLLRQLRKQKIDNLLD